MTMTEFLADIGAFFTQCTTWVGDLLDIIVANPALLVLVIAMPLVGFTVGLLGRLLRA